MPRSVCRTKKQKKKALADLHCGANDVERVLGPKHVCRHVLDANKVAHNLNQRVGLNARARLGRLHVHFGLQELGLHIVRNCKSKLERWWLWWWWWSRGRR